MRVKRQIWSGSIALLLGGAGLAALAGESFAAAAAAQQCALSGPTQAMQVDADCFDPTFNAGNFVIDAVTQEVAPSPHRRVRAHFSATDTTPRFNVTFYLPPKDKWQGRFFQHVYPLQQDENKGDIDFALKSGGYLVNVEGVPCACGGYRADAAAAKLARAYAAKYYSSSKHIYGYIWGGSGGSFQTIGAAENTRGVWDGAVPFVIANEGALLNYNAILALTGFALKDRIDAVVDAVKPGGSGDAMAGLDPDQRAILKEALAMGVPLRGLEDKPMFHPSGLGFLSTLVLQGDPGYVEDFWTKPGYEGVDPPAYLKAAIVDRDATIIKIVRDAGGRPTGVELSPALAPNAVNVEGTPMGADGKPLAQPIAFMAGGNSVLGQATSNDAPVSVGGVLGLSPMTDPAALGALREGGTLHLSNRRMLALMYYHRHSLPPAGDLYIYDQFRKTDGTPRYPQRPVSVSRMGMLRTAGGGTQNGNLTMKIIIVDSLLDVSAFPYGGDYYAGKVRQTMGGAVFANNVRLWYQDNADHFDDASIRPANAARLVSYVPVLYQALRDMAAWVERGVSAPASTRYHIADGQVVVPASADERRGVQPVVELTAGGGHRVDVSVNQPVLLRGVVSVPGGTGKVVSTHWYLGEGPVGYVPGDPVKSPAPTITVSKKVSFARPGIYFVTLRGESQRDGRLGDPAVLQNIDRVRVIVH